MKMFVMKMIIIIIDNSLLKHSIVYSQVYMVSSYGAQKIMNIL